MNKNELIVFLLHSCDFSNSIPYPYDATLDHSCIDAAQPEMLALTRVDEFHRVYAEAGGEFFAAGMWVC